MPSLLAILFSFFYDRDLARLHPGSWASALLSCAHPRIFFRLSEQRLLHAALRGLTDEELADDLAVSLSAVKKSWRTIYLRAGEALPSQFPDIVNQDAESRRGKEKKQRLLAYLRDHMEELRPTVRPKE